MSIEDLPHGKPFIFKLLNHNLNISLDENNFVLSLPKFALGQLNTEIELSPKIGSNMYGKHKFSYSRLPLETLGEISLVYQNEEFIHDLIPRINSLDLIHVDENSPLKFLEDLGVPYIAASEILNKRISPLGNSNERFLMMAARPNSFVFTGSVSIKLTRN